MSSSSAVTDVEAPTSVAPADFFPKVLSDFQRVQKYQSKLGIVNPQGNTSMNSLRFQEPSATGVSAVKQHEEDQKRCLEKVELCSLQQLANSAISYRLDPTSDKGRQYPTTEPHKMTVYIADMFQDKTEEQREELMEGICSHVEEDIAERYFAMTARTTGNATTPRDVQRSVVEALVAIIQQSEEYAGVHKNFQDTHQNLSVNELEAQLKQLHPVQSTHARWSFDPRTRRIFVRPLNDALTQTILSDQVTRTHSAKQTFTAGDLAAHADALASLVENYQHDKQEDDKEQNSWMPQSILHPAASHPAAEPQTSATLESSLNNIANRPEFTKGDGVPSDLDLSKYLPAINDPSNPGDDIQWEHGAGPSPGSTQLATLFSDKRRINPRKVGLSLVSHQDLDGQSIGSLLVQSVSPQSLG